MRKSFVWLAALAVFLAGVFVGFDTADAQMGFGGFGGGGFGGGRGFGGGGFGRGGYGGGAYGGRAFGQGAGFGRRDAGTGSRGAFSSTARGPRVPRDSNARAERGGHSDQRAYRAPTNTPSRIPTRRVATYPTHPRPPVFHPRPPIIIAGPRHPRPPVIVAAPPPPPAVVAPPIEPRQLTATPGVPGGAGSPPPAPPKPAVADRNFSVPAFDERRYVPNEVVLTTAADVSPERLQRVETRLGLTPLAATRIKLLDVDVRRYRISDNSSVRGTVQGLQGDPDIRSAQPNYLFELQGDEHASEMVVTKVEGAETPTKPAAVAEPTRPMQYAIAAMKLEGAHKLAEGDAVLIAVIDTGLDETHPEIAGMVADRFDAVGGTYRAHSHGTAMGGVIVAHKDLVGIAPKARLLAIRAFDNVSNGSGQGTTYDILRGLDFAADHKAQIINMSFAGPRDELLCEALAKARTLGMIEIAAAGNGGPDSAPLYPAAEPGVLAITATDTHNRLFAMANRGGYVAAAAPGVDIVAPGVGGAVQLSSGTSIAAAEASGVVALLLQAHPGISSEDVRKVLSQTAPQMPDATGQPTQVIDALAAVQAMEHAPQPTAARN